MSSSVCGILVSMLFSYLKSPIEEAIQSTLLVSATMVPYCNVAIIGFFPQVCQEEELVCRFVIMEYLAVIGVGEQL